MIKETTKNRSGNNLTFAIIIIAIIIRVMLHVRTSLTYWLYMLTHQCDIYGSVRSVKKLCTNLLLVSATSNYHTELIVTIRSDSRYHYVEDRGGCDPQISLIKGGFGSCNHVGNRGGCNHEILLIRGGRIVATTPVGLIGVTDDSLTPKGWLASHGSGWGWPSYHSLVTTNVMLHLCNIYIYSRVDKMGYRVKFKLTRQPI
jgi:hypothetical protein